MVRSTGGEVRYARLLRLLSLSRSRFPLSDYRPPDLRTYDTTTDPLLVGRFRIGRSSWFKCDDVTITLRFMLKERLFMG